jgi:hypothetical protein
VTESTASFRPVEIWDAIRVGRRAAIAGRTEIAGTPEGMREDRVAAS